MKGVSTNDKAKEGHPSYKDVILPLLARLTWKWLQICTDMLLIITSTGDDLLRNVHIDDLEWPWTPKLGGFSRFFRDFGKRPAFQEWIAPKWLEIDQDNLRMKFLALNVDFSSESPDPLILFIWYFLPKTSNYWETVSILNWRFSGDCVSEKKTLVTKVVTTTKYNKFPR